jgi:7-cyano-7-deazaguanine synthase
MNGDVRRAVVLHSGGIDSTTVLAIARVEGFEPCAMTFRYGQRHAHELACAARIADAMGISTRAEMNIDLRQFGGSALTAAIAVPKDRPASEIRSGIPVTYVPARNTIFLSYALGWAEVLGVADIYIGVNAIDYSGYPDCRPEFIEAFQRAANLGTKAGVEKGNIVIHTPLISMTKAEIIKTGVRLGVDYSLTSSCYDPDPEGRACGRCDSCLLRLKGFSEAGIQDPVPYVP